MPQLPPHYYSSAELMGSRLPCILLLLLSCAFCAFAYKEFALSRSAVATRPANCSLQAEGSSSVFRELCYSKDVSYHLQLLIDGLVYYVAVDLTAPLSWLKAPECRSGAGGCRIIQDSQKAHAEEEFKDVRVRFRMFGRQHDSPHPSDVAILGSSDFIAGEMQSVEFAEFYAKDPRSVRDLTRLVGMSLFLAPERDRITIRNATLVKAERLSQDVNEMVDGAISFRPASLPNSLLSQLFANSQTGQQIATIFIHPLSKTGTVSLGDISLKNARGRLSQVSWVSMGTATEGFTFSSIGMAIGEAFARASPEAVLNITKDIVLTTSSSYIFLPKDSLNWLTNTLKTLTGASCWIQADSGAYRCEWTQEDGKRGAIPLALTFHLPHSSIRIPFTTLILVSEGLFLELAIAESPEGKIILGEPLFQQYVAFIDYASQRVGFLPAVFHQSDKFTSLLVYFLRLLLFSAIFLFLSYICYSPCAKFKRLAEGRLRRFRRQWGKIGQESLDELGQAEQFS